MTQKQKKLISITKTEIKILEKKRNALIIRGFISLQEAFETSFFEFLDFKEQKELINLDKKLGYDSYLNDGIYFVNEDDQSEIYAPKESLKKKKKSKNHNLDEDDLISEGIIETRLDCEEEKPGFEKNEDDY